MIDRLMGGIDEEVMAAARETKTGAVIGQRGSGTFRAVREGSASLRGPGCEPPVELRDGKHQEPLNVSVICHLPGKLLVLPRSTDREWATTGASFAQRTRAEEGELC